MKMTMLFSARRAVVPPSSLGSSPTSSPTPTRDRGGTGKGKGKGGGRSRTPSRGAPPLLPGSLPAGWVSQVDPSSGNTFYANTATGHVQWALPQANTPRLAHVLGATGCRPGVWRCGPNIYVGMCQMGVWICTEDVQNCVVTVVWT